MKKMELWLIILLSAVGGFLILVLIFLTIWACRKRRRRNRSLKHQGQNGQPWQAHDHIVEISDDENSPKLDGLCKDTISGSTFPKRVKKNADENEKQEDGLCRDTRNRSLRRGKLSEAFSTTEQKRQSPSENPPEGTVTKFESRENVSNTLQNGTVLHGDAIIHQPRHENESSDSSFDKTKRKAPQRSKSIDKLKKPVQRKRSKSIGNYIDVPEYCKPVKRAVSNPSIVARQKMIENDKRFESLETWKCSIPIPEPDYPLEHPFITKPMDDVKIPQSTATSDSGVECIDDSRDDDESDNVHELQGIGFMAQSLKTDNESHLFTASSSHHERTVSYVSHQNQSFSDNQATIITIAQPPELPGAFKSTNMLMNSVPSSSEQHVKAFAQPPELPGAFKSTNMSMSSALSSSEQHVKAFAQPPELPGAFKSTNMLMGSVPSSSEQHVKAFAQPPELPGAFKSTNISMSSVPSSSEQHVKAFAQPPELPGAFKSTNMSMSSVPSGQHVKALSSNKKPTNFWVPSEQKITVTQDDSRKVLPSAFEIEARDTGPTQLPTINKKPVAREHTIQSTDTYQPTATGFLSKTVTKTQKPSPSSSNNEVDFRHFKLRSTPDSIKQQIGFREELHPNTSLTNNTQTTTTISTENTSIKDTTRIQQPQNIYGQNVLKTNVSQHTTNQKSEFKVFDLPANNRGINPDADINGSIIKTQHISTKVESSDLVIHRLQNQNPVPGKAVTAKESVTMRQTNHPKHLTESINAEDKKRNWRREQMEHRLSTELLRNERQPLMHASGLALKSVMPELFTKIKERDQKENGDVAIAT